jgi:hypothetical protein
METTGHDNLCGRDDDSPHLDQTVLEWLSDDLRNNRMFAELSPHGNDGEDDARNEEEEENSEESPDDEGSPADEFSREFVMAVMGGIHSS